MRRSCLHTSQSDVGLTRRPLYSAGTSQTDIGVTRWPLYSAGGHNPPSRPSPNQRTNAAQQRQGEYTIGTFTTAGIGLQVRLHISGSNSWSNTSGHRLV